MAFWGAVVNPGNPYIHSCDQLKGRLKLCQATLGDGKGEVMSTVQCKVGDEENIYLCKLIPNISETCHLDVEFEEEEDVTFSVLGPRSVHLSGYFVESNDDQQCIHSSEDTEDSDSDDWRAAYGEDESDSDETLDLDNDTDSEPSYSPQIKRKSGVVIEEIVEDGKPEDVKTSQVSADKFPQIPDVVIEEILEDEKPDGDKPALLESEDEDGFPKSITTSKAAALNKDNSGIDKTSGVDGRKRKIDLIDRSSDLARNIVAANEKPSEETNENIETSSKKKKKIKDKKTAEIGAEALNAGRASSEQNEVADGVDGTKSKKKKEKTKGKNSDTGTEVDADASMKEPVPQPQNDKTSSQTSERDANDGSSEKSKKKRKNKKNKEKIVNSEKSPADPVKGEDRKQSVQKRAYPNGLIIEELSMDKPDGKRASPGKQVFVNYIGKLSKDGKIFDSSVGKRPFKFRLGTGQVIKDWDVGVNGMRVGDKRRLTVPPAMAYGSTTVGGGLIPANSTLVFDVELVDVK